MRKLKPLSHQVNLSHNRGTALSGQKPRPFDDSVYTVDTVITAEPVASIAPKLPATPPVGDLAGETPPEMRTVSTV
jgi:hypothetical protein